MTHDEGFPSSSALPVSSPPVSVPASHPPEVRPAAPVDPCEDAPGDPP